MRLVTIYTGIEKLDFMKRNQLIPHPEGEITLYQRFWYGPIGQSDTHLAPVLLTYADLTDTMDLRCIDEAQELIKENKL